MAARLLRGAAGLLLLAAVAAVPAEALTIEEARREALGQSTRLDAARAEAEAASDDAGAASTSRLPRLHASMDATRSNHPVMVFSSKLGQERFSADDFGRFDPATGTFDLSALNTPDPVSNVRWAASVHLPLWTGGAIGGRLDAARAQAEAARETAQRTEEQVLFDTEGAFRLSVLAEDRVQLLRESLALARAEAARVDSLWSEGLALQSDRQALKAHVSEIQARLASARADSVEARSLLGLVLGRDEPVAEPLADPDHAEPPVPSLATTLEAASERGDVRAAHHQTQAAGAGVSMARSQYLPDIGVMAGAEHNSKDVFGSGGDQWVVGLGIHWKFDLGSPQAKGAAAARERAAREYASLATEGARHQVRAAHARALAARERYDALTAAVASAQEAYRLVETRHQEGLATTLELTESQNTLTRTRLEAASARHDRALAVAALHLASGTMISPEDS